MNFAGKLLNRGERYRLNRVLKASREPHCAQHSQLIFTKAKCRLPNRTDDACLEIVLPSNEIQHLVVDWIEEKPIDREIPALHIRARIAAEAHLIGMPTVGIPDIAAKSRDFNTGFVVMAR